MKKILKAGHLNRRCILFVCVIIIVCALVCFLWGMSCYFGWRDHGYYTVTTWGDEWSILFTDEYKSVFQEDETVYDMIVQGCSIRAENLNGIKEVICGGTFHETAESTGDLAIAYTMPNLAVVKKIKAPKNLESCPQHAATVPLKFSGELVHTISFAIDDRTDAAFYLYTDLSFNYVLDNFYSQSGNVQGNTLSKKLSDRNALLLRYPTDTGEGAVIKYTLSDVNTTWYVKETYLIDYSKHEGTSRLDIYGVDEGLYFGFSSITEHHNVDENWNPERPEVELLMQFGVQRVIPTAVVIVSGIIVVAALIGGIVILRKKPHILRNALRRKKYDGEASGNNDCEQFSQKP